MTEGDGELLRRYTKEKPGRKRPQKKLDIVGGLGFNRVLTDNVH
jgi:hypothetical protein